MAYRPAGTSVQSCFRVIPDKDLVPELNQALDAVALVHGDGILPQMVLDLLDLIPPNVSQLNINRSTRQPQAIAISPNNPTRRLGVLHEVGHLLDWSGFFPIGEFSSSLGLLSNWQSAIFASPTVQNLQKVLETGLHVDTGDGLVQLEVAKPLAAYFLRTEELFARSYAQYIVLKAQNSWLQAELESIRRKTPLMRLSQWEVTEFMQIAEEFDRLLLEQGWIR
jgi:hypothetical protein